MSAARLVAEVRADERSPPPSPGRGRLRVPRRAPRARAALSARRLFFAAQLVETTEAFSASPSAFGGAKHGAGSRRQRSLRCGVVVHVADRRAEITERSRPPRRGDGERRAAAARSRSGDSAADGTALGVVDSRSRWILVSVLFFVFVFRPAASRYRSSSAPKAAWSVAPSPSHCRRGSPFGRDGARLTASAAGDPRPPFVASGSRVSSRRGGGVGPSVRRAGPAGRRSPRSSSPSSLNEAARSPRSPARRASSSSATSTRFRPTSPPSWPTSPATTASAPRARRLRRVAGSSISSNSADRASASRRPLLQVRNEQLLLDAVPRARRRNGSRRPVVGSRPCARNSARGVTDDELAAYWLSGNSIPLMELPIDFVCVRTTRHLRDRRAGEPGTPAAAHVFGAKRYDGWCDRVLLDAAALGFPRVGRRRRLRARRARQRIRPQQGVPRLRRRLRTLCLADGRRRAFGQLLTADAFIVIARLLAKREFQRPLRRKHARTGRTPPAARSRAASRAARGSFAPAAILGGAAHSAAAAFSSSKIGRPITSSAGSAPHACEPAFRRRPTAMARVWHRRRRNW